MGSRCYLSSRGECIWQQQWFMRLHEKNINRIFSPAKMDKRRGGFFLSFYSIKLIVMTFIHLRRVTQLDYIKEKNKIIHEKTAGFFCTGHHIITSR